MNHIGDATNDRKRLRMQDEAHQLRRHHPTLHDEVNWKCTKTLKKEAFLLIRIIKAVDIDRDFRSVTNERFYGVVCWVNPEDEYRTRAVAPNLFNYNLDPVWEEHVSVPLLETTVDKAVLRLVVLRGSRVADDPGCSNGRKLVGRAEFKVDQLENWGTAKVKLELLEPVGFEWKPEGYILLEMQLLVFPVEPSVVVEDPADEVYESDVEEVSDAE